MDRSYGTRRFHTLGCAGARGAHPDQLLHYPCGHAAPAHAKMCHQSSATPPCPDPVSRHVLSTHNTAPEHKTATPGHRNPIMRVTCREPPVTSWPHIHRRKRASMLTESAVRKLGGPQPPRDAPDASGLLTTAAARPDVHKESKATCRHAGVKIGESNMRVTCSVWREDHGDMRLSRGHARATTCDTPEVLAVERSLKCSGTCAAWAAAG